MSTLLRVAFQPLYCLMLPDTALCIPQMQINGIHGDAQLLGNLAGGALDGEDLLFLEERDDLLVLVGGRNVRIVHGLRAGSFDGLADERIAVADKGLCDIDSIL